MIIGYSPKEVIQMTQFKKDGAAVCYLASNKEELKKVVESTGKHKWNEIFYHEHDAEIKKE